MNQYFYEVFENIPRQGPGLNESTRQAYEAVKPFLPEKPRILDIGCGKGVQTLELARISGGTITAIDNRSFFLECLERDAGEAGLGHLITTVKADMGDLPFPKNSFDLIWSEGAIFILGFKHGVDYWKDFLTPGGFLVFSDLVWRRTGWPKELEAYWRGELSYVLTIPEALSWAEEKGYRVEDHFTLPQEGWSEAFYGPQQKVIDRLRVKYPENQEAHATFDDLEGEKEIVLKNLHFISYEFFLLQRLEG